MNIRRLWSRVRRIVPVSVYPLLSPIYRWDRRRTIRRLKAADARYRDRYPDVVAPDAELRFNVVGACDIPGFLEGGRRTADDIEAALGHVEVAINGLRRGLDFGCGCGRFLLEAPRRWPWMRWSGSDVDEPAVRWCADHLPGVEVVANSSLPPLPFPDGTFDIVWCGSVFTHLDEDRQDAWLEEVCRILAPGGCLLATVHGPNCWSGRLPRWTVRRIQERGFIFARTGADEGIHPDWYQTAWHTRAYVESHWSRMLDVAAYIPQGFGEYQDLVVCRRPAELGAAFVPGSQQRCDGVVALQSRRHDTN
jgi:SAM-dependent methyltransferase